MYFVWISEQTVTFALYIINRWGFKTEVESVYCAVGLSRVSLIHFVLKGLI